MNRTEIKVFILRALARAQGQPLPATTISAAVRLAFPQWKLPDADTAAIVRELEADGYAAGTHDDLMGELWGLTPKGILRAQQL